MEVRIIVQKGSSWRRECVIAKADSARRVHYTFSQFPCLINLHLRPSLKSPSNIPNSDRTDAVGQQAEAMRAPKLASFNSIFALKDLAERTLSWQGHPHRNIDRLPKLLPDLALVVISPSKDRLQ
jgi:hypothetical protein